MVGFIYITQIYKYYYHILPLKSTLLINYPTFEHLFALHRFLWVHFTTRAVNLEKVAINIEGMTCEIGCAKTIESKLSKTEGINIVSISFDDKNGIIEYDANKTDKDKIVAVVEEIAGGDLYKVTGTKLIEDTN